MRRETVETPGVIALREAFAQIGVDFIARLADAWDQKGQSIFTASGVEHLALLALAGLPASLARSRWAELSGEERFALLKAARRAIEFGRQCAWVFGEGEGARF
jgi:hypothetical protein